MAATSCTLPLYGIKKNKMDNIFENIIEEKDVVFNPDHPYAYYSPEIICRIKSQIFCFFIPRKEELRSPNKILFRLLNTRLVYPPKSTMVIVLDKDSEFKLEYELDKVYFDLAVLKSDLKKYSRSIFKEKKDSKDVKKLKIIQKDNFNFQSSNYLNNISFIENKEWDNKDVEFQDDNLHKPKYKDSLFRSNFRPRSKIYKGEETYFGIKNLSNKRSDLHELKPFFQFSMRMNYSFDNGVPYSQFLKEKVISLNSIPTRKFDPLKPIRILSLFGWLISNSNNIDDINKRIQYKIK